MGYIIKIHGMEHFYLSNNYDNTIERSVSKLSDNHKTLYMYTTCLSFIEYTGSEIDRVLRLTIRL